MGTASNTKQRIIELLQSTGRDGITELIAWMEENSFFTSPASTKFHGCYEGALADHSLGVYNLLSGYVASTNIDAVDRPGQKPYPVAEANIIIAALLHDVCKAGAYLGTSKPYQWNKVFSGKGHASYSIERIQALIELEPVEEVMIRFHMGFYGLKELYEPGSWDYKANAEYSIKADHSNDKQNMSKEEKDADKAKRFCKTMRNAWYHQPICKLMYFCDEIESLQAKANE